MVKVIKKVINSTATMSDNDEYRYRLVKIWDWNLKIAGIIMLNPSKADVIKVDATVMNITNYLIDNGYGGIDIVNLYAYRTTDPRFLTNRDQQFESINNDYIHEVTKDRDIMIIAWGSDNNKYKTRKREVERILLPYSEKLKCFEDESGKQPRHPLLLADDWCLTNYQFKFLG